MGFVLSMVGLIKFKKIKGGKNMKKWIFLAMVIGFQAATVFL